MAKTVASIIADAKTYSRRNRGTKIVVESELVREINSAHVEILTRHPNRFTQETPVAAPGNARAPWILPASGVGRVSGIFKTADGEFVEFAPFRDRDVLVGNGVYFSGPRYYPGSTNDPDPENDGLTFIHGLIPAALAAGDSTHADFPVEYERMLVLRAAYYMAAKEGRMSESMRIDDEHQDLMAQLDATSALWGEHGYRADGSNPSYGGSGVYRP